MTDQFTSYDAAYLIGALSAPDRQAYEAHLEHCDDCARAVNRLAGIPGLLARLSPQEAAKLAELDGEQSPADAVPQSLLPKLLAEVSTQRTRRHWALALTSMAAAAAVLVAILVGTIGGTTGSAQPPTLALQPVVSTIASPAHLTATAQLDGQAWGTHIRLSCTYDGSAYSPGTYLLVVTNRRGQTQRLATWSVVPGMTSTVDGSTSWSRSAIASVQVRTEQNKPLLALHL
ncbi:MAG: anti-sigma factor family protein [Nocardioidaceae bacterium]